MTRIIRWFKTLGVDTTKARYAVVRFVDSLNPLVILTGNGPPGYADRVEHVWPPYNYKRRSRLLWMAVDGPLARAGVFIPQHRRKSGSPFRTFHGEHLTIADALGRFEIEAKDCFFVDIGSGDGINMSNTFLLAEAGAQGIHLELNPSKFAMLATTFRSLSGVSLARTSVTPLNVNSLLDGLGCPSRPTLLNLDIDSYDYDVLKAVLEKRDFSFLCLEINPLFPIEIEFKVNFPSPGWSGDFFQGMSLSLAHSLLSAYGYQITHIDRAFVFAISKKLDLAWSPERSIQELGGLLDDSLGGSDWDYVREGFRGKPVAEIEVSIQNLFADKPKESFFLRAVQ